MKKGLVKGLTCLSLAGIMFGAVAGFAGCNDSESDAQVGSGAYKETLAKGMYILVVLRMELLTKKERKQRPKLPL